MTPRTRRAILAVGLLPVFVAASVIAAIGHWSLMASLLRASDALQAFASKGQAQHVVATAGVPLFGVVCYFFRWNQRTFFAVVEVSFAICCAWFVLGSTMQREATFVTLMGATYVVVRGIDNFAVGWAERKAEDTARRAK